MNEFIYTFTLAFICLIAYMYYENMTSEIVKVAYNNNEYFVRNRNDKEQAAELLDHIRNRLIKLVDYLEKTEPDSEISKRLVRKFNPDVLVEKPAGSKHTSYTINKGEKIVICLRNKNEKLIDINTLMFVCIHEISHIANKSIGHNSDFWNTFSEILKKSIKIGIYKPVNYNKNPKPYCGIEITSSPIY